MDADAKLLRRYARTRNAHAFAELAQRYSGLVYGVSMRITGNNHDAEDVTQECFLELAKSADTITSSLPGWLHTVATHRSFNKIRTAVRQREREQGAVEMDQDLPPAWANIAPIVDRAVQDLPEDLRGAVILHFLEGKTQADVARRLGVNQSTVSRQLKTGVDQIRLRLRKAGITVSLALLTSLLAEHAAAVTVPASVTAVLGKMAVAGIRETAEVATAAASGAAGGAGGESTWFGVPLNTAAAVAVVTVVGVGVGALLYTLVPSSRSDFGDGLSRPAVASAALENQAEDGARGVVAPPLPDNGMAAAPEGLIAGFSEFYADDSEADGRLGAGRSTPARIYAANDADLVDDTYLPEEEADDAGRADYDSTEGGSGRNVGMLAATAGADSRGGEDGAGNNVRTTGYSGVPGDRPDGAMGVGAGAGMSSGVTDPELEINDFVFSADRLWALTDEGMFSYDWLRRRWMARGVDVTELGDPERTVLIDDDGNVVYDVLAGGGRRTYVIPPHRQRSR